MLIEWTVHKFCLQYKTFINMCFTECNNNIILLLPQVPTLYNRNKHITRLSSITYLLKIVFHTRVCNKVFIACKPRRKKQQNCYLYFVANENIQNNLLWFVTHLYQKQHYLSNWYGSHVRLYPICYIVSLCKF